MLRSVLAALLVLTFAAGVAAEHRHAPIANTDAQFQRIDNTSPHVWGKLYASVAYYDSLPWALVNADTAGTGSINPGSTAIPTALYFQVPAESGLDVLYFAFEEMQPSTVAAADSVEYAWGDTMVYLVAELKTTDCIDVGLWRRARIWGGGTAGVVDIYVWTPLMRD